MTKPEILREIVEQHQARKVTETVDGKQRKLYIDALSANAILKVYDALNDQNKALFVSKPWGIMARVAWKCVKAA